MDKERKMVTLDFGEPWGAITVPAELALSMLSNQGLKDEVRDVVMSEVEPDSTQAEDRADIEARLAESYTEEYLRAIRRTWSEDYKDRLVSRDLEQVLDTVGY